MSLDFDSIDFSSPQHILVLGAGHFGTALALHLLKHTAHSVTLYDVDNTIIEGINRNHRNPKFLSSVQLEPAERLTATTELNEALLAKHGVLLFIVPTQFLRSSLKLLAPFVTKNHLLIFANKGIEVGTDKFAHEIISEELGDEMSHLSTFMAGPSFAVELAQEMPTAVTMAGFDRARAAAAQRVLSHGRYLRVYTTQDPIGEELCGALKNVIAIASGMVEGLNFGANTRAALVTRGLHEMMLIGTALGCQPLTFMGLCGVGDLLVTCTSEKSRNYSLGEHLGRGENAEEALRLIGSTVEGYFTSKAVYHLAKRLGLSEKTNIINQVYYILYEGKPIKQALEDLLAVVPGEEALVQAQASA